MQNPNSTISISYSDTTLPNFLFCRICRTLYAHTCPSGCILCLLRVFEFGGVIIVAVYFTFVSSDECAAQSGVLTNRPISYFHSHDPGTGCPSRALPPQNIREKIDKLPDAAAAEGSADDIYALSVEICWQLIRKPLYRFYIILHRFASV